MAFTDTDYKTLMDGVNQKRDEEEQKELNERINNNFQIDNVDEQSLSNQAGNITSMQQRAQAAQQGLAGAKEKAASISGWTSLADIPSRMIGVQQPDRYKEILQKIGARPETDLAQASSGITNEQNKYKNMLDLWKVKQSNQVDPLKRKIQEATLNKLNKETSLLGKESTTTTKMGAAEKEKFGIAESALQAVKDMDQALVKEGRKGMISIVGDSPYTMAKRTFAEMLGRLQSGGAINKDEEARFNKMAPTVFDDEEIARVKLQKLQDMIGRRLEIYSGKSPDKSEISYGKEQPQKFETNILPSAEASTQQDSEAVQWAKQNANDPRAKKILQLNGVK